MTGTKQVPATEIVATMRDNEADSSSPIKASLAQRLVCHSGNLEGARVAFVDRAVGHNPDKTKGCSNNNLLVSR